MSRFVFVAALLCAAPALAETRYFSEIGDLPLPMGFTEVEAATGFNSGQGRLVMVRAEGAGTLQAVRAFYLESLPALGWSFSPSSGGGALLFRRGREQLTLIASEFGARTRVTAQLVVQPASMNAD